MRFSRSTGLALPRAPGEGPRESPQREAEGVELPSSEDGEVGLDGRPLDADATVDDYARPVGPPQEPANGLSMDGLDDALAAARDRDEMAAAWKMNLVNLRAAEPSPGLWQSSTEACCGRHKVEPLFSALEAYDVWFTGLRREQSPSRAHLAHLEPFRLPSGRLIRKVSPVATWTTREVWAYARQHEIPLLPLYDAGYTSIGCEPCTAIPDDPANPRSGRWSGKKLECGIHISER